MHTHTQDVLQHLLKFSLLTIFGRGGMNTEAKYQLLYSSIKYTLLVIVDKKMLG